MLLLSLVFFLETMMKLGFVHAMTHARKKKKKKKILNHVKKVQNNGVKCLHLFTAMDSTLAEICTHINIYIYSEEV